MENREIGRRILRQLMIRLKAGEYHQIDWEPAATDCILLDAKEFPVLELEEFERIAVEELISVLENHTAMEAKIIPSQNNEEYDEGDKT